MGCINQLPPSIINQIAAGEVIERPASVVKELLENAVDAGATRVELTVERGGKDLVRIADNGSGISRDDLPLAFHPHATSKLTEPDDLFRIHTLGFRGEALAAIAEVSKVRCQTRTDQEETGSELVIEGGVASAVRDCASPVGTVIEVRNLFFNTPVRRTFLKSDATEAGHVVDMLARVALAHPHVHMVYRSAGKTQYDLSASAGLKDRVAAFFGQELADSLIWVESRSGSTHVRGYVAHPSQSRSSSKSQFLFVGGRYVRDRALGHALSEAYRGLLMVGRYPVAFLFLDLPPDEVDVNVHPTKIEVRFRDGHQVYSQLLSTIRGTFLASDLHSRLQTSRETSLPAAPSAPSSLPQAPLATGPSPAGFALQAGQDRRQEVASWFTPSPQTQPSLPSNPIPSITLREEPGWVSSLPPRDPRPADKSLFDEFEPTPASPVGSGTAPPVRSTDQAAPPLNAIQVHDSYLIVETTEGLVVIDQHALHERILFEELRSRVESGGIESQRLLIPEPVDLAAVDRAMVLERKDVLARLGLMVDDFGGDTVLVSSLPVMLGDVSPARLLQDLADHFRATPLAPEPDALLEDALSMIACKAAVKAGQPLSTQEIASLLERGHLTHNTHHCPHGRPTALTFTRAELERQFGRT